MSAAGIFFTNGTKVLILKKNKDSKHAGTWGIPGGKALKGEIPLETAKREAKEECGYNQGKQFGKYARQDWTAFFFKVNHLFDCKLSDEHTDWKWVNISDLDKYPLHPKFKKNLKEYLLVMKKPSNFKEWLLLTEMPHVKILNCGDGVKINGYKVCAIDFKFEDWERFSLGLNMSTPFIAKTKENRWLLYHGGFANSEIEYSFQKPDVDYVELPKIWGDYAEFYDDDYNVVKPAKMDAIARLS